MKILELTNFSAGACGVWTRVFSESKELVKRGHEVRVFSSNLIKGSDKYASFSEIIEGIKITRFPFKKLGGESFMKWNFSEAARDFKPDIIIAHVYRHPHTLKALKLAKEFNSKCFLVTHAPFIEGNTTRSILSKIIVNLYDLFIGPRTINNFDKVIAISEWEKSYLKKLGLKEEKLIIIPNTVPDEFFLIKPSKEENKILFLGRVSPVKNLEIIINVLDFINDKNIILEIVGPYEEAYLEELKSLVNKKNNKNRVVFSQPIYLLKEKIHKIDTAKIFILPSKREALPQVLIEAMARGKLIVSSKTLGGRELITGKKNGLLFDIDDESQLVDCINFCLEAKSKPKLNNIKNNALSTAKKFKLSNAVTKLESLF